MAYGTGTFFVRAVAVGTDSRLRQQGTYCSVHPDPSYRRRKTNKGRRQLEKKYRYGKKKLARASIKNRYGSNPHQKRIDD